MDRQTDKHGDSYMYIPPKPCLLKDTCKYISLSYNTISAFISYNTY